MKFVIPFILVFAVSTFLWYFATPEVKAGVKKWALRLMGPLLVALLLVGGAFLFFLNFNPKVV